MQTDRRTNPYPYTWEIPAALTLAVLLVLILGVHAAAAAANLAAGTGAHWPAHTDWITVLPRILAGDSSAGVPVTHPAPRPLLWACLAVIELALVATMTVAGVLLRRRYGLARIKGMATRSEAATLLGPGRLRRVAPIVRPDLYSHHRGTR